MHNILPNYPGHFFKKSTNKSFTQFVVDMRLGYASKLLLSSNDSISEIAYKKTVSLLYYKQVLLLL